MTKPFILAVGTSALLLTAAPELQQPTPEIRTQDEVAVFQSKTTLIEVPVVVRDRNGKIIDRLRQEDFQLFEKGQPQMISRFSIERSGGGKAIPSVPGGEQAAGENATPPPVVAADHFVALLFDDLHTNFADMAATRVAARKFIASGLKKNDRAAIFTTSGQLTLDFTDDRERLDEAVMKLAPHPRSIIGSKCPEISFYQSRLMVDINDSGAINVAIGDYEKCFPLTPYPLALESVMGTARQVYVEGAPDTLGTIDNIKQVVRRMAGMPGQRTLILASPGFFLLPDQHREEGPAIDLAIRSGVVIDALNVRGIIGIPSLNAENGGANKEKDRFQRAAMIEESAILENLTSGTGGGYFRGNFLELGFDQFGKAPEAIYLLGFSPQNLKFDGKFHSLKVTLKTPDGMSVEARRGYYAPDHLASAEEDAKEEVNQALFSRDEMNDIPVEMNTRFFKTSESEARLSVTSRVDVRKLRFRKADDRNVNDVRLVCALFDRDGNLVQTAAKMIRMQLQDDTLQGEKLNGGVSVRSDFTIPPGTYVIRLVLRDAEGQSMTALNRAVRIP